MNSMPFAWFDLALFVALWLGVMRGRKRGMSEELLDLLKWLAVVVVAGLAHRSLGETLAGYLAMDLSNAYLLAYAALTFGVLLFFGWVRSRVGDRVLGNDAFGGMEYYLGMVAGGVGIFCVTMVFLAILNSRYVSPAEKAQNAKMQQDHFGSMGYPTIGSIQDDIFTKSMSGKFIYEHFRDQLIDGAPPGMVGLSGAAERNVRALNQASEPSRQ